MSNAERLPMGRECALRDAQPLPCRRDIDLDFFDLLVEGLPFSRAVLLFLHDAHNWTLADSAEMIGCQVSTASRELAQARQDVATRHDLTDLIDHVADRDQLYSTERMI